MDKLSGVKTIQKTFVNDKTRAVHIVPVTTLNQALEKQQVAMFTSACAIELKRYTHLFKCKQKTFVIQPLERKKAQTFLFECVEHLCLCTLT